MTKRNDFITDLEDYLVEFDGETPLPERVRDAVRAELPATRQARAVAGGRTGTHMSSTTPKIARWGLVAAGLVAAVGLGAAILLPSVGLDVGATVATPTPAPTPMPSPSAASTLNTLQTARIVPCEGGGNPWCIEPGTYLLGPAVPGGLIDVPAGWSEWNPGAGSVGLLVERDDVADGSGWGLTIMQVGKVRRDPCDRSAGTFGPADVDTPAEFAAVMATWPGFAATSPAPVEVGGIDGVQVRLTTTRDLADCAGAVLWETPVGIPIDAYPMLADGAGGVVHPAEFRIIERDGQLLAIRTLPSARTSPYERTQGIPDDPTRYEADLVMQQAIVDSIRFDGITP